MTDPDSIARPWSRAILALVLFVGMAMAVAPTASGQDEGGFIWSPDWDSPCCFRYQFECPSIPGGATAFVQITADNIYRLSPATLDAVRRRVQEGAVAVVARHLAPRNAQSGPDGKGTWVITDDVVSAEVRQAAPFLGKPGELRYVFGDTEVVFTPLPADKTKVTESFHSLR